MTKGSRLFMATVRTDQKQRALMRAVPESFSKALAKYFGSGPTDIALARKQHAAYAQALLDCGLEVTILPADENHPDCIFVEDQAIVIDGHVLLPLPGHPSRVAEQPPIADFLSRQLNGFQVCGMFGDARMDGGDLLRLGNIFFVARSKRTNDAGIETLRNLLTHLGHELRIIDIPTEKALHLTSISSTPTDQVILTAEGFLSADDFGELPEGCKVIFLPEEEVYGCNTIGLGNGKVLVAKGYPTVLETVEKLGLEPIVLDMSQIREADGSITCCTLFF
ncbi:MAG: arginine deiminase-related protein [Candidatus Poseidoniaceae archaeon]|nr:arginine deiminase-related protein [Candidatus Poseidoniaceae archaeon]